MNARAQQVSRCEAHGICLSESTSCASGKCAQASAARVYSDLADTIAPPKKEARNPIAQPDPIVRGDCFPRVPDLGESFLHLDNTMRLLDVLFKGCIVLFVLVLCCILFASSTNLTTVAIYKFDASIREAVVSALNWVFP